MHWFNGGHMIWMTISWILGIGLLVMFTWLLVAAFSGRPQLSSSPEEILRRRYAAGEIDTEEYEHRLSKLRDTKSAA
jgi:putative membrane protein